MRRAAQRRPRAGWVTVPLTGPAQPQAVGSTDVSSTWTLPGSASRLHRHRARTPARFECWCTRSAGRRRRPTPFSTWGNFMTTRLRRAVRRLRQKERLMRAFANKKMLGLLALVAAAAGFAVYTTASHAAAVPVSLCAKTGSVTMPDSTIVDTWGFVLGDCQRHGHCRGRRSGARGQRRRRGHDQPHEQPAGRPHGLVRALGAAGQGPRWRPVPVHCLSSRDVRLPEPRRCWAAGGDGAVRSLDRPPGSRAGGLRVVVLLDYRGIGIHERIRPRMRARARVRSTRCSTRTPTRST